MMADMRNRVRAVEAARMSKLVGPRDKSIGLARRGEDVARYCAAYDLDLVGIAEDTDVSGSTDPFERKGLGSWLQRPGDWDVIVAADLDRVGRNARHLTHLRDWCEDNGKRLIILSPHLEWPAEENDIGSPIMWDLLGRLAQYELEGITKRNRETRAWLQRKGALAVKAPYGYIIVGVRTEKTLEIHPITGPILREAATRYLAGETLQEIADDFNARGLPSRNTPSPKYDGPRWHRNKVGEYLRDTATCGRLQQGDYVLKFPGIITVAEHKAICERLDSRAHHRGIRKENRELLTSVLFCGYCQKGMYAIWAGRPPKKYHYYYCQNTHCPRKPRLMIPLDFADTAVTVQVQEMLEHEPVYRTEIVHGHDYEDEIDQLKLDLAALDPELDSWETQVSEIRAEIKRLRELPTVPPREIQVPTGEYIGDVFARQDVANQRETLLTAKVKIHATREGDDFKFRMDAPGLKALSA
jgi:DNA invertase Pin-like site-specific DNA recombinase